MKILCSFLIGVFISLTCFSQSCLPEGIYFSFQSEIDSFQVDYPNCTEIEGDVTISGDDITNLYGLNVITHIGGSLTIFNNLIINNLDGLNNLTTINRDLWIDANDSLVSLIGLENDISINGSLKIGYNPSLPSLTGLDNLALVADHILIYNNPALMEINGLASINYIGKSLEIANCSALSNIEGLNNLDSLGDRLFLSHNDVLTNLAGLTNLTHIGASLVVQHNATLTNISNLENLVSIDGNLWIYDNIALSNLTGLQNISAGSIDSLYILDNPALSICDVNSICDYLESPNGTIDVHDNATGCNSQSEVEAACLNNCLPDGITFATQAQIDSFQVNYPNCTEIQGGVTIWGYDIVNLNGLSNITKIVGFLVIRDNPVLTNLTGLQYVTQIGGTLYIGNCNALTSIDGIKNIDASSIILLHIIGNISLSECAVQSICDYLASPNGFFEIYGNGSGCGSEGEVFYQCLEGVNEPEQIGELTVSPNPTSTSITIELPTTSPINNTTLSIYNVNAQQVISRRITEQITVLDIGTLPSGVYFARITTDRKVQVGKFMKQ